MGPMPGDVPSLLGKSKKSGLISLSDNEASDQQARNLELALKSRREKMAYDKLKIPPEQDKEI